MIELNLLTNQLPLSYFAGIFFANRMICDGLEKTNHIPATREQISTDFFHNGCLFCESQ